MLPLTAGRGCSRANREGAAPFSVSVPPGGLRCCLPHLSLPPALGSPGAAGAGEGAVVAVCLSLEFPSFPASGIHVEEKLGRPGLGSGDAPRKLPRMTGVARGESRHLLISRESPRRPFPPDPGGRTGVPSI